MLFCTWAFRSSIKSKNGRIHKFSIIQDLSCGWIFKILVNKYRIFKYKKYDVTTYPKILTRRIPIKNLRKETDTQLWISLYPLNRHLQIWVFFFFFLNCFSWIQMNWVNSICYQIRWVPVVLTESSLVGKGLPTNQLDLSLIQTLRLIWKRNYTNHKTIQSAWLSPAEVRTRQYE